MPLLLDTFNILHTVGVLPPDLAGIDVQGLIGLLKISRYRHERITLACDGVPDRSRPQPPAQSDNFIIRYSGPAKSADDLIAQVIRASSAPRRLIVVSSDHEVLRTARRRRCPTLTSETFLQQLADDAGLAAKTPATGASKPPAGAMTNKQIDRWIRLFGLDDRIVAIPPGQQAMPTPDPPAAAEEASEANSAANSAASEESSPAEPHDIPELPPGPELPIDIVQEAERLVEQSRRQERGGRRSSEA